MTIKGFKVGQAVVILGDGGSRRQGRTDATVTKVGRKYVTVLPVKGGYETKYRDCDDTQCSYLIEQTEYGSPRLLFPSSRSADCYLERETLKRWLMDAAGRDSINQYTLEQLREVKRILEHIRPENGPLTLEELECMVGEKVWVERIGAREHGYYATVEGVTFSGYVLHLAGGTYYNYGAWKAYRQKPEEEKNA